jgi:hypothetical protein
MGLMSRWAEARRQYTGVELPEDVPVTRQRFRVEVEQNHDTAGMSITTGFKWRWSVIDKATGRSQRNDYALTRNMAEDMANRYVSKIVAGKRPVK